MMPTAVRRLRDVRMADAAEVGGKAAGLGELFATGARVPDGLVLTAATAGMSPDERRSLLRAASIVAVLAVWELGGRIPVALTFPSFTATAGARAGAGSPGLPAPMRIKASCTAPRREPSSACGSELLIT